MVEKLRDVKVERESSTVFTQCDMCIIWGCTAW